VITPSAARGVLEAIYWKPAIRWVITKIHILREPRFISFKRNEISQRASQDKEFIKVEDTRQQRNTIALRDVDYVIEAHFVFDPKLAPNDNIAKHVGIIQRRFAKGQTFHQPYLGCREFAAEVVSIRNDAEMPPSHLPDNWRNRKLGLMLHDLEFGSTNRPRFFNAEIVDGVMTVPPWTRTMPAQESPMEVSP
jgi:CRISPR-associated protein Cas5d